MSDSIKAIQSEIVWCKKNRGYCSAEHEKGFIAGLEQAKFLVMRAETDAAWQKCGMDEWREQIRKDANHE